MGVSGPVHRPVRPRSGSGIVEVREVDDERTHQSPPEPPLVTGAGAAATAVLVPVTPTHRFRADTRSERRSAPSGGRWQSRSSTTWGGGRVTAARPGRFLSWNVATPCWLKGPRRSAVSRRRCSCMRLGVRPRADAAPVRGSSAERAGARPHLRAAVEMFASVHAALWEERARNEVRATGEVVRRRDPAAIWQHVAGSADPPDRRPRASYRDAAAELFLWCRTIEYHRGRSSPSPGSSRAELVRMRLDGEPHPARHA